MLSDIILVGLRDYQDAKADVIMKYNSDEARRLKNLGHLPESVNVSVSICEIFIFKCFIKIEFGIEDDGDVDFLMDDSDNECDVPEQPYQPDIR